MIYGRRFSEKNQPQQNQMGLWKDATKINKNRKAPNWSLQFRYAPPFVFAGLISSLLFIGPAWYFTSENFSIFQKIAYDTDPHLISYLEREIVWLSFFLIAALVINVCFNLYTSFRLTKSVMDPLSKLERHMYQVIQGNWDDLPEFSWQDKEMENFANTYFYFFETLRLDAEEELRTLQQLTIDPDNKPAAANLESLIKIKKAQLGYTKRNPLTDHVAKSAAIPKKRRAS